MVEICSIGALIERKRTKAKDQYSNAPVYAVTNNRGFVLSSSLHDFDIFSDDTSNYMVVSKNDFAYNPSRLNVGSIAYFKEEGNGLISPMYVVFHADENKILAEYLYIVIKSEFVRNKIDALKEVGARFRFDFNRWDLIKIPIPSLEEQTRIVEILDTFTSAIDNLKEQIAQRRKQYEYYRDQLLDLEGKEGVKIGSVATFVKDRIIATNLTSQNYISVENLLKDKAGRQDAENVPTEGNWIKYNKGDVLIGNIRPYLRKIWLSDREGGTNGDVIVLRGEQNTILSQYLYYVLSSERFFIYYNQSLKDGKMPRGEKARVLTYTFPLLPKEEQSRIVSILDTFEASIANLEAQLKEREKQYEYYRNKLLTFE